MDSSWMDSFDIFDVFGTGAYCDIYKKCVLHADKLSRIHI